MKTSQLPVSRKFYSEIHQRVNSSFSAINSNAGIRTLEMIDQYLIYGSEPPINSPSDSLLVFFLLKPEIDKAIKRSQVARQRAILRHRSKATAEEQEKTEISINQEITSEGDLNSQSSEALSAGTTPPAGSLAEETDTIPDQEASHPTQGQKATKKRNKKRRKRHHKSPKAAMY